MENKKETKVTNDTYKERFQFLLKVNENIICQRYFRINGFDPEAIESYEFKETLDYCVSMVKEDLKSKSRIFQWYTRDEPVKLTGFVDKNEATFFNYPDESTDKYSDNERLEPYEVTFDFSFLVDDKIVYEYIWDGTDYPKYIRNSVDLTNSDSMYRDREPMSLHFSVAIVRYITIGRVDLVYHIIKNICNALSNQNNENNYTKSIKYSKDKKYYLSTYNRNYVNSWRDAVKQKTNDYYASINISPKKFEYIENKL